eukprot:s1071_g3.t1
MQLIDLLIVFSSWLLSLFLTLHEDVEAVLWIALVLGCATWTLSAMEPLHFVAFGQLLALQQTLLSALPGEGCRPSQRGLRWNLPAAWLPSMQQHEQLLLDTAIAKLLDTASSAASVGGGPGCFHTPVEEAVTYAETERHRMSDFVEAIRADHSAVASLTQNYLRVLALCIHQLQTLPTDETLEQDQEQLRDQSLGSRRDQRIFLETMGIPSGRNQVLDDWNIGGWVGSLGRSLEADQALSCLEKSQSREEAQA